MNEKELDQLRLEDIDFFAKKYSELFGEHFDKNTVQEKEEFYEEIKEELLKKVQKYLIVDDIQKTTETYQPMAISWGNKNCFIREVIGNKVVRIHELVHSYNSVNGVTGLRLYKP